MLGRSRSPGASPLQASRQASAARAGTRKGINVPVEYWDYGWPGNLHLSTKALYLICLVEAKESKNNPWWQRSLNAIAKKYSLKRLTVNKALRALERHYGKAAVRKAYDALSDRSVQRMGYTVAVTGET